MNFGQDCGEGDGIHLPTLTGVAAQLDDSGEVLTNAAEEFVTELAADVDHLGVPQIGEWHLGLAQTCGIPLRLIHSWPQRSHLQKY